MNRLWLDYGGAFAVANVRGGGEYGEPWHEAGKLTRKQNVFDDFAACMTFLVEAQIHAAGTPRDHGRSNGGLLMGAALTQHPLAMRAVVSEVESTTRCAGRPSPMANSMSPNSARWRSPNSFKALQAYSPLLRVRDGVGYPAVPCYQRRQRRPRRAL